MTGQQMMGGLLDQGKTFSGLQSLRGFGTPQLFSRDPEVVNGVLIPNLLWNVMVTLFL